MNKIKLKTNVKCAACVAAITPAMNQLELERWEVDLNSPDRLLTAEGEAGADKIKEALKNSGYQGESI
ncbi:MAG: heavy metal transport/detoxification protein [Cyclobacteriaceae bacterium]